LQRMLHRDRLTVRAANIRLQGLTKAAVLVLVGAQRREHGLARAAAKVIGEEPTLQHPRVAPDECLGARKDVRHDSSPSFIAIRRIVYLWNGDNCQSPLMCAPGMMAYSEPRPDVDLSDDRR